MTILWAMPINVMASGDIARCPFVLSNPAGGATISAGVGRRGERALVCDDVTPIQIAYTGAPQTYIFGMALSTAEEGQAQSATLVEGFDGGTRHNRFGVNSSLKITFALNTTVVLTGTTSVPTNVGSFWSLEGKVKIGNAGTGTVNIYLNSVSEISDADEDTQNGGNASIDRIQCLNPTTSYYRMDMYGSNTSGSAPWNDVLGDVRVDALLANGDGSTQNFTSSSGGGNSTNVDDATTSDAEYNYSANPGDIDLYTIADPTDLTDTTIFAVMAFAAFLKSDAGARSAAVRVKSGATSVSGTASALVTTASVYLVHMMELNPNTSAAWTVSALDALEVGGTITA